MSILKVVILEGTFPELPSSKMYATGRGTGSSLKVAAANAIRNLLKQPALKSRRITAAKIVMSVGTKESESKTGQVLHTIDGLGEAYDR